MNTIFTWLEQISNPHFVDCNNLYYNHEHYTMKAGIVRGIPSFVILMAYLTQAHDYIRFYNLLDTDWTRCWFYGQLGKSRAIIDMCLWLLTACLGLIPSNPNPNVVIVPIGIPSPILVPTPAPTIAPPTLPPTIPPTLPPTIPTAIPTGLPATTAPPVLTRAPPTVTTAPPAMTTAPPVVTTAPPAVTTAPPAVAITPPAVTTAPPAVTTAPPAVTTVPPAITTAPPAMTTAPPPITTAVTTIPPTVTTVMTLGGVLLPVLLCTNPDIVCIINPNDYQTTTGPPINPRLGTTPGSSAALQNPAITAYSAPIPAYNSAVKFPRERRSVRAEDQKSKRNINKFVASLYSNSTGHKVSKRQAVNCICVTAGTCPTGSNNGAGMIDVRIVTPVQVQCAMGQVYCCTPPAASVACGTLQTVPATPVTPGAGQANFGEFPWQAMILTRQNDYIAGGVLIDQVNVLTVRHRLATYIVSGTTPNVKVRLGEWDAAGVYEPVAFQEYAVLKVFVHPSYNSLTLQYDIMVLRLAATVPLTPTAGAAVTINRACLPPAANSVYTGQRCMVSGWGQDMFGAQGQYQQILKKVDVPIVAPATCQSELQAARLGANFVLDTTSFVCAGGEANKDSCTGDGGSGLVCQVNGQWVLVGLVAWGLGCASPNVPGVYVNIAALLPWIQQQVATP